MKPEQQEIDRLRKEVAKLKAARDILKKAGAPDKIMRDPQSPRLRQFLKMS